MFLVTLVISHLRLALPLSARPVAAVACSIPWRPPFSMCTGRGITTPRHPTQKSSRQSLPRSRGPRDYKQTAHVLEHRQHPAPKGPTDRSHGKWVPSLGRSPGCHRQHFAVTLSPGQRTPHQRSPEQAATVCRSRSPRRQACKEHTDPELFQTHRCKFVVFAIYVDGRWIQETTTFLRLLAQAKARTIPASLKASFPNALIHR